MEKKKIHLGLSRLEYKHPPPQLLFYSIQLDMRRKKLDFQDLLI
ncbi:hypothetical protein CCACVL1_02207 [Corchorus capsularis]|uniref:Uncharacterized protein n=1 Tax=Corchorus capsularis TaxID=210143 RepID=A0A1R3KAC5_COCAP|nr:hypothetical protein CCACVL1_02207 [Corchorus capsularis]